MNKIKFAVKISVKVGMYFMAKCISFTAAQSVNGFIDPKFELC
jgi:hypothetical protein